MDDGSFLVTGGCGLQGSHIVEKLLAAYPTCRVTVMARNPTMNTFPGVTYLKGDITSSSDIDHVFNAVRPTVVFHCAGTMTVGRKHVPEDVVRAINIEGTRKLLDASKRSGVKAFVFTSSATVVQKYEKGFRDLKNCDETAPTVQEEDGGMIYALTKAEAERIVIAADDPASLRTVALRSAAIYGERDSDIIPNMMAAYRAGRHRLQIGDNTNLLDYTYAGNAADAHLLAATHLLRPHPTGVAGEAFFITNGAPTLFWDFVRTVFRAAGDRTQPDQIRVVSRGVALSLAWVLESVAWFTGSKPVLSTDIVKYATMHRWYNINKARKRLGYEPRVDWEEGIRRSVKVSLPFGLSLC